MHVVLGRAPIRLRASAAARKRLRHVAGGRPLIIDFFAVRTRGPSIGDLIVDFDEARLGPAFVEVAPVDDVPVLVRRPLVPILARGATLIPRPRWWPLGSPIWIRLRHPEDWLGFLEGRPISADRA